MPYKIDFGENVKRPKADIPPREYGLAIYRWRRLLHIPEGWNIAHDPQMEEHDTSRFSLRARRCVIGPLSILAVSRGITVEDYILHEMLHVLFAEVTHHAHMSRGGEAAQRRMIERYEREDAACEVLRKLILGKKEAADE